MRLTQSDDFSVSITQGNKSIKEFPVGVDSFSEEKKEPLEVISRSVTLLRLYKT